MHHFIDWVILIVGVLGVPYTHGILGYFVLIAAAVLLIALNHAIERHRKAAP